MKLYEFAVIYNPLPTKDQADRGDDPKSELLVDVTRILCNNEKEAQMVAARSIPDTHIGKLDRIGDRSAPFLRAPLADQARGIVRGAQDFAADTERDAGMAMKRAMAHPQFLGQAAMGVASNATYTSASTIR